MIIVSYNVKYFLEQCLYSVLGAVKDIEAEILVVDNHSADGSRAYLEHRFPTVSFTWQESNTGFGRANNSMLKKAKGKYVLFLNPDTIIAEDCFTKCLAVLKADQTIGALGLRMIDGSGRFLKESKRGYPSPLASLFKMTGLAALFPSSRLFAAYYAGHLTETTDHEVDVLAGAFMMISRNCLDAVKGFDEDFFMYGEDIDLSYRIQQAGFRNYYFAGTTIIHFKGESTQRDSVLFIRMFYDAMEKFVNKHYKDRGFSRLAMIIAIILSRSLAILKLYLQKVFTSGTGQEIVLQTAVMSDQTVFDKLLHNIENCGNPLQVKGRIAIEKDDTGDQLTHVDDIASGIKKLPVGQLLFCQGKISFKEIIAMATTLSGSAAFLFHAENSESIVGSNRKHRKGLFIPLS